MEEHSRYLKFRIGDEHFALPISRTQEVIRYNPITPLHENSDLLKGIINLRGKVVPIIDIRPRLNMKTVNYDERTVFIIVENEHSGHTTAVGLVADEVSDVIEIDQREINRTPDLGLNFRNQYLNGIAQIDNQMLMLLDIEGFLDKSAAPVEEALSAR